MWKKKKEKNQMTRNEQLAAWSLLIAAIKNQGKFNDIGELTNDAIAIRDVLESQD